MNRLNLNLHYRIVDLVVDLADYLDRFGLYSEPKDIMLLPTFKTPENAVHIS